MLACERPQYSAHCPRYVPGLSIVNDVWLLWPGTTSRLPLSSGTQKLWITLQPPGSDASHAVRSMLISRPVGTCISLAVTTLVLPLVAG